MTNNLTWKKYHPLTDQNAFICLVDSMGDDSSIVQAARVSYGKDEQENILNLVTSPVSGSLIRRLKIWLTTKDMNFWDLQVNHKYSEWVRIGTPDKELIQNSKYSWILKGCNTAGPTEWPNEKDRQLIRYLMNHSHTTPFEMVEFKFMVQVPMDCWRQWIRHRTASVNEYSTRYTEALDFFQVTSPSEWRLQASDNKQGSSGFLEEGDLAEAFTREPKTGCDLTVLEDNFHCMARHIYEERLTLGIAKEQARKDLPLSTYTRAYWKCDLHNIFNFLRLRMDSHAQLEIRSFANSMFEIVQQICPVACGAFEDYVLNAKKISHMELNLLHRIVREWERDSSNTKEHLPHQNMTDREWKEFLEKLS
jgi:flavin-dependent thymidylate synthase